MTPAPRKPMRCSTVPLNVWKACTWLCCAVRETWIDCPDQLRHQVCCAAAEPPCAAGAVSAGTLMPELSQLWQLTTLHLNNNNFWGR
jgi:hypothetical protein